ncbi:MAG: hypothetical protein KGR46_00640 [Verrucomicrobia bacterium]|nr:hypothetical protein [Verrucomicrobiota bacterium]
MPLLIALLLLPLAAFAQNPIHVTYLWHMHQPIYFPYESVSQTDSNGRFNFSVRGVHDARTGAYGDWPKNAVQQSADLPHAGVQVSFSGSLMENMDGLYGQGWRSHYRWGRNGLRTTRNNPRLDLVGIAYHHSLMPLTTKEAMRMQVRLHKEAYKDVWDTGGSYSKGFWPPECAFDVNMIPALADEGIQWVIVDNGHFDRACQGYPWAPASSVRPNKADQLNPNPADNGSEWVQLQNVWAPTRVSAPWGYQPRFVQYIDPASNPASPNVKKIIAVPAGRYEGNENARGGYGAFKPENVWGSNVAVNNDPQRPMLILCHSDGDNFGMLNADAYNGQHGNFLNMTRSNPNFKHTSVQDYLELYPVPANDIIHVEPGSWVGIDGGTPYYDKWRENNPRDGEHPDLWSWSVLVAAANRVIHADNLESSYSMNDVRWGIGPDTAKAWRFYLQAETSCHWYWDFDRANPWDGNASRGANLAIAEANKVINRSPGTDRVGPTIWPPQRDIWNPGGLQFNEATPASGNFTVFTFVDDVSGLQSVKLYWRTDNDGENPINEYDNELYAANPAKNSAWNVVDMTGDWYPTVKGPQVPDPANRAMRYRAPINGQNNVLIDYFVESTDNKGNTSRSDIDQVWVGSNTGGGGGGGNGTSSAVTLVPSIPVAGLPLTVTYNPAGRGLASATSVNIHHGSNGANWTALPGVPMTKNGSVWNFTYTVPGNATTIAMVFNSGGNNWDNNNNLNWNFSVDTQPPTSTPPAPTGLSVSTNSSTSVNLSWNSSPTAMGYRVFRDGVQIASPTNPNFVNTGLTPETSYSYFVRAYNNIGDSDDSSTVSVTTPFTPVGGNSIIIIEPGALLEVANGNYTFRGRAGGNFTAGLRWTNNATGQNGTIAFPGGSVANGWEWTATIPLAEGPNTLSFTGLIQSSGNQTLTDSPANYTGFSANSTGGQGFGQWFFNHSAQNAGAFLADNPTTMNVGGTKGWGLWANNGGRAAITRSFNTPMKSGDSFNVRFDNNWITDGSEVGLELRSANGTVRLRFSFIGGQQTYRVLDGAGNRSSTIGYTANGTTLNLSLGTGNAYTLTAGNGSVSGNLTAGDPITWMEFFNNNAGSGSNYDVFVGAMTHTIATTGNQTITQNSSITRVTELNTDGLPNTWWSSHNFSTGNRVASADPDADGFTNAQEHALGTDPTSAASRFMAHAPERNGNSVTVNWSTVSGKTYRVQSKADLSAPWVDVGLPFTANGTTGSQSIPIPDGATKHFFRIRLVQ